MLLAFKDNKEVFEWKRIANLIKHPDRKDGNLEILEGRVRIFKETISYVIKLHNEEKISEEQFKRMMTTICAAFITNAIESRINETFDKKLFEFLEKI